MTVNGTIERALKEMKTDAITVLQAIVNRLMDDYVNVMHENGGAGGATVLNGVLQVIQVELDESQSVIDRFQAGEKGLDPQEVMAACDQCVRLSNASSLLLTCLTKRCHQDIALIERVTAGLKSAYPSSPDNEDDADLSA